MTIDPPDGQPPTRNGRLGLPETGSLHWLNPGGGPRSVSHRSAPRRPAVPLVQYGIDYTFMRLLGREPVRWLHGLPIAVRITGTSDRRLAVALVHVINELRAATRMNLVVSEPWAVAADPVAVPAQEIHVSCLAADMLARMSPACLGRAGAGGATTAADGRSYRSGYAIMNSDVVGPDPTSGYALAVLRHQLGHALGLGHATRPSQVMHQRVPTAGYGHGDRRGLTLLGVEPAVAPLAPSSPPHVRTPPCAL